MNEGSPFTHTPPQKDPVPRSGASRKGKVEEALDKIARAEIDESVETPSVQEEEVSEIPDESIVAVYTTPRSGGTSLRDIMPILTEQANDAQANETEAHEPKDEDVEEITEEELEREIAKRMQALSVPQEETSVMPSAPIRVSRTESGKPKKVAVRDVVPPQQLHETSVVSKRIQLEQALLERLKTLGNWEDYRFEDRVDRDGYLLEKTLHDKQGRVIQTNRVKPSDIIRPDQYREVVRGLGKEFLEFQEPQPDTAETVALNETEVVQEGSMPAEAAKEDTPDKDSVDDSAAEVSVVTSTSLEELESAAPTTEPETSPAEVSQATQEEGEPPTPEVHPREQLSESQAPPVAVEVASDSVPLETAESGVGITRAFNPEGAAARITAREKYRELRGAMLAAKTEWEKVMQEYHNTQAQKGILGKLFDGNHYKEQIAEKQGNYLALLEQVRSERENRMNTFMAGLADKKGARGENEIKQYTAFHEALLDRRIDQDIVLIERASIRTAQPESTARFLGAVKQAGRWYSGLSVKDKAKFGAAVGFAVGGGAALFTGTALIGGLGVGTIAAARRVGGVLATSTVGGAMAGFVKGKADAFASKYVETKIKDTKDTETFSKTKLNETLEQRLKIKKTGKQIRTAGTVGAGATVVGTALVVGGSIAQGVQEALPESAQKAIEVASAAEVPPAIPETEVESMQPADELPSEEQIATPAEDSIPPASIESVPPDVELKDLIDTYLNNEGQLQPSETGPELQEVPDDVPGHMENINAEPIEPTPVYTVEKGDNIWKILEKKLEARGSLESLNTAQRIHIIDALKDEIANLSPEERMQMGISSGDADVVRVGDTIDLSEVLDDESIGKALSDTEGLTPDQVKHILMQRKDAMSGIVDSTPTSVLHGELPTTQLEPTEPPPFTSVGSQTTPPFTSISSLSESVPEQTTPGVEVRLGDFPQAGVDLERAMEFDTIGNVDAYDSRAVIVRLFSEHAIFSRAVEGYEKTIRANWNAISHVRMGDVYDGNSKLVLDGGRAAPIVMGADAERLVHTLLDQVENGMGERGVPHVHELLEQAKKEDWAVGKFFDEVGKEIAAHEQASTSLEPTATLAALDASEIVAEQTVPLENTSNIELELNPTEQERAMTTLEKLSRVNAEERLTNPTQQRLSMERAAKVLIQHYAAEEKIDMESALERLNQMTGDYADKYLGDADGIIEADEGNALRDFAENNPGFRILRQMVEDNHSTHIPQPVATLASLDASEIVAHTESAPPATTEHEAFHESNTNLKNANSEVPPSNILHDPRYIIGALPDELEMGYVYTREGGMSRIDGVNQPNNNPWLKIPVDEYNKQHPDNPMATGGVVEETPPKGLEAHDEPKKKIERPRRTEPLFQAEVSGVTDNDKVTVGGRVGVRIGGGEPIRYVDVRMNDPISPRAEHLITSEYLTKYPEWKTASAGDLLERDPAFEKAWNERVLHIRGEGSRTPIYRTHIDPRDLEQLKTMNGGDALKQLEDQLEEYNERNMRRVRFPRHRIRIKPFKD